MPGPRQSGKTTLCRSVFADLDYANLDAPHVREFAAADPRRFLACPSGGGGVCGGLSMRPVRCSWGAPRWRAASFGTAASRVPKMWHRAVSPQARDFSRGHAATSSQSWRVWDSTGPAAPAAGLGSLAQIRPTASPIFLMMDPTC